LSRPVKFRHPGTESSAYFAGSLNIHCKELRLSVLLARYRPRIILGIFPGPMLDLHQFIKPHEACVHAKNKMVAFTYYHCFHSRLAAPMGRV
ncbi:hypothetical protein ACPF7Z_19335, partial [Halomonas sp. GXIMD04776]|uniref:hypothetical protein n=1 Tax=Halomonas sp. GXIMD04776 TaxID=3415605 RepID=UPI003C8C8AFE